MEAALAVLCLLSPLARLCRANNSLQVQTRVRI